MVTPLADSVASQRGQGEHWGMLTGFGIKAAFELFEVDVHCVDEGVRF